MILKPLGIDQNPSKRLAMGFRDQLMMKRNPDGR